MLREAEGLESTVFLAIQERLVRPEGIEPPAYRFEACRSIQLSYGRILLIPINLAAFVLIVLFFTPQDFPQVPTL